VNIRHDQGPCRGGVNIIAAWAGRQVPQALPLAGALSSLAGYGVVWRYTSSPCATPAAPRRPAFLTAPLSARRSPIAAIGRATLRPASPLPSCSCSPPPGCTQPTGMGMRLRMNRWSTGICTRTMRIISSDRATRAGAACATRTARAPRAQPCAFAGSACTAPALKTQSRAPRALSSPESS